MNTIRHSITECILHSMKVKSIKLSTGQWVLNFNSGALLGVCAIVCYFNPDMTLLTDFLFTRRDCLRETTLLTRQLGSAAKECEDLSLAAEATEAAVKVEQQAEERPRFTLPELKDILQERNSLKARVSDLEDELAVFRPGPAL